MIDCTTDWPHNHVVDTEIDPALYYVSSLPHLRNLREQSTGYASCMSVTRIARWKINYRSMDFHQC